MPRPIASVNHIVYLLSPWYNNYAILTVKSRWRGGIMNRSLKLLLIFFGTMLVLFFLLPLLLKSVVLDRDTLAFLSLLLIFPAIGFVLTLLFAKLGANWILSSIVPLLCFVPTAFLVFGVKSAVPYMLGYLLSAGIGGYIGKNWRKSSKKGPAAIRVGQPPAASSPLPSEMENSAPK